MHTQKKLDAARVKQAIDFLCALCWLFTVLLGGFVMLMINPAPALITVILFAASVPLSARLYARLARKILCDLQSDHL